MNISAHGKYPVRLLIWLDVEKPHISDRSQTAGATIRGPRSLVFLIDSDIVAARTDSYSDFATLLSIHRWNQSMNANYLYTIPIHTVWACETVCFAAWNGPFCNLKRTVLERKMACISNPLYLSKLERQLKFRFCLIYFYNSSHYPNICINRN